MDDKELYLDGPDDSRNLERKLELVVQTGLLLAQSHDLQVIVQSATDAGVQLSGAQFGAFFYNVTDAAGESYVLYTISGVERERFSKFPMPRKTAVFGPTFDGTAVVRSDDITKDERYGKNAPYYGMPAGHLPVRSYLAVPVKSASGDVLGGLFFGHEAAGVFRDESEELILAVAAQAAVAIENAHLRGELTGKLAELETRDERQRLFAKKMNELAAIVESSDDAIISKDLNGTITSWNAAATRILGFSADEMVGSSILKLIPEHLRSDETTIISNIKAGRRVEHFETQRLCKKGELLDVSLTVSPVRDAAGAIVGASKILRDVSSRKRMETSLLQAEKLAATGRMAATIAHEINNPLEAVMNLLYLLRPVVGDAEGQQYLSSAENELTRVAHIAKQTLGYYREQASASSLSLSELAGEAMRIYEPRMMSSGITVEMSLASTQQVMVRRGETMQVISNLLANAIYAMPDGGKLRVATEDVKEPAAGVQLTIADNGVGIAEENLQRIFEAFFTTRAMIGTGIGLFVARQFVESHGGSISVESSVRPEDHGTAVHVFFPIHTTYDAK